MDKDNMRMFIVTKGRYDAISTHKVFKDLDYTIVVHNEEEKQKYCANPTIDPARVVVSGVPTGQYGQVHQLNFVFDNLTEKGEWFLFADDDILSLTAVPEPYYKAPALDVKSKEIDWKAIYDTPCSNERFVAICREMIEVAGRIGAHWCGFAAVDNFFFRGKKWATSAYVVGVLTLSQNTGLRFDPEISMSDMAMTAEQLFTYGSILVNHYVCPINRHFLKGGLGVYEDRIPYRLKDCEILMKRYAGLFRYRKSYPGVKNYVPKTDLQIRLHNKKQVAAWRKKMGVI